MATQLRSVSVSPSIGVHTTQPFSQVKLFAIRVQSDHESQFWAKASYVCDALSIRSGARLPSAFQMNRRTTAYMRTHSCLFPR